MARTINLSSDIKKLFIENYSLLLREKVIPEVINLIMSSFRDKLYNLVTDEESLLRPELYEDKLYNFLYNDFDYLNITDDMVRFTCPALDTVEFPEELSLINTLTAGIVGTVCEVKGYTIIKALKTEFYNDTIISPTESYLLPISDALDIIGDSKYIKPYELSNSQPIDIFDTASSFVSNTITTIQEEALSNTLKQVGDR